MKVGITGVGAVGAATAMAIALRVRARGRVLLDCDDCSCHLRPFQTAQ
jgi:malate/lactate dehydrogenase